MRRGYFIDQMHNGKSGFAPKSTWDTGRQDKKVSGLNNMFMFSFNDPILLRSVSIKGLVHSTTKDKYFRKG